jgi:DNA-binding NarL/FixJ family response regulator
MRPSVLIADDHPMFAEALRDLLSPAYDVVGIAANGRELTEMAVKHKPNLVVTDLSMPLLNGLNAITTLTRMGLRSKFIIVTMHADVSVAVEAFRSGTSALVMKSATADELKEAMRVVSAGGCYLSPKFPSDLVTLLAEAARRPAADRTSQITPRQREVLQLFAEGKSMKEIASQLNLSTRTVESHKYQVMNVLGIKTNAELVQYAIKIGLITVKPMNAPA